MSLCIHKFHSITLGSLVSCTDSHNVRWKLSSQGYFKRQEWNSEAPIQSFLQLLWFQTPLPTWLTTPFLLPAPVTYHTYKQPYDSFSFPDGTIFFVYFNSRNSCFTFTHKHKVYYILGLEECNSGIKPYWEYSGINLYLQLASLS